MSAKSKMYSQKLQQMNFDQLLEAMKIQNADYVIIGDGSGTNWNHSIGWASVLVDCRTGSTEIFHGSFSQGTSIIAEMMACFQPLLYLTATKEVFGKSCHIVSDCEFVSQASKQHPNRMKRNKELWGLLEGIRRQGLQVTVHWAPRNSLLMNKFSHKLANVNRLAKSRLEQRALSSFNLETVGDLKMSAKEQLVQASKKKVRLKNTPKKTVKKKTTRTKTPKKR